MGEGRHPPGGVGEVLNQPGRMLDSAVHRGETPFLHGMRDNAHTHQFYQCIGLRNYCELLMRVVSLA